MRTEAGIDVTRASMARVYDYWRGGREHHGPDEALARAVEALYPPGAGPRQLVAANRAYLERAVSSTVHDGITQVIDLGSGFPRTPRSPALHEVARSARSSAAVAYVDTDILVVSHVQNAEVPVRGVTAARCDLTRPGDVMAHPDVRSVIDPGRPVLAVLGLVLHFLPATDARRVVAGWADWLAPGSRFAVTVAHWDDEGLFERMRAVYGPARLHNHSAVQAAGMLRGLDLLGAGIEVARGWGPEPLEADGPACILGAVARKS